MCAGTRAQRTPAVAPRTTARGRRCCRRAAAAVARERGGERRTAVDAQSCEAPARADVEDVDGAALQRHGDRVTVGGDAGVAPGGPPRRIGGPSARPVRASHSRSVPSSPVVTIRRPSALVVGVKTRSWCPRRRAWTRPLGVDEAEEAVEPRTTAIRPSAANTGACRRAGDPPGDRAASAARSVGCRRRSRRRRLQGHERAAVAADGCGGEEPVPLDPDAAAGGERPPEPPVAGEVPADDAAVEAGGVERAPALGPPPPRARGRRGPRTSR